MKRIALFGGAGAIGKAIGTSIDNNYYEITSFDFIASESFENFIISKDNIHSLINKLDEYSYCIIAIQKQSGTKNNLDFEFINTDLPNIISKKKCFDKIIYITTALIDPAIDNDIFSNTVFKGEKMFKENQKNKNYTIIRPGNLLNKRIPNYFTKMVNKIKSGKMIFLLGDGSLNIQFTLIGDLANYINFSLKNNTPTQVHLYSTEKISIEELISRLKLLVKSDSKIFKIPNFAPLLLLKLFSLFNKNYYPQIRIRALIKENISEDNLDGIVKMKQAVDVFTKEYNLID